MSEQDRGSEADDKPVAGMAFRLAAVVASLKATMEAAAPGLVAEAERLGAGRYNALEFPQSPEGWVAALQRLELRGDDHASPSPEEIEAREILAGVEERLAALEQRTDRLMHQYGL